MSQEPRLRTRSCSIRALRFATGTSLNASAVAFLPRLLSVSYTPTSVSYITFDGTAESGKRHRTIACER
jgi:hypothetical protein